LCLGGSREGFALFGHHHPIFTVVHPCRLVASEQVPRRVPGWAKADAKFPGMVTFCTPPFCRCARYVFYTGGNNA
jgi:hypothetical protein